MGLGFGGPDPMSVGCYFLLAFAEIAALRIVNVAPVAGFLASVLPLAKVELPEPAAAP